jgi:hypothetical protein
LSRGATEAAPVGGGGADAGPQAASPKTASPNDTLEKIRPINRL